MNKKKTKKCKTKGCTNPVIDDGKLCNYCKAKNGERNKKIMFGFLGTVITVIFGLFTGLFKKAIMLVVKGFQFFH